MVGSGDGYSGVVEIPEGVRNITVICSDSRRISEDCSALRKYSLYAVFLLAIT